MKFTVSNKLIFEAEFFGKYNVIIGNSAVGKTTLYNLLHEAEDNVPGYSIQIDCPYHVLDKRESSDALEKYSNTLLILDENCKLLHLANTSEVLKNSSNRFLIISRVIPKFLPLGVKNLFQLSQTALEYRLVPVYEKKDLRHFDNVQNIITEDSDAGLKFFKANFDVVSESSFGNGNLATALADMHADNKTLAVFDSAGIVPVAKKLYRVLKRHNIQYLDWDSFEAYVLTQEPISEVINYDNADFESIEQYASAKLGNILNYNKGNLPSCLVYDQGCDSCSEDCVYRGQQFSSDLEISSAENYAEESHIF